MLKHCNYKNNIALILSVPFFNHERAVTEDAQRRLNRSTHELPVRSHNMEVAPLRIIKGVGEGLDHTQIAGIRYAKSCSLVHLLQSLHKENEFFNKQHDKFTKTRK